MVEPISLLLSGDVAVLLVGIVLLYVGAELLVDGAASLALGYGMHATTVGVTVIAFATTAPELIVSTVGGVTESDGIALGNIIGSNVANIGLVLGMSTVAYPMRVDRSLVRKHGPFMLLAVVGLVALSADSLLGMIDGILLLGLLAVYTGYIIYRARRSDNAVLPDELAPEDEQTGSRLDVLKLLGAIICLLAGSRALIVGGQGVLHALGFGDLFVGLTIIAFGTSMPELATSLVSAYREGAAFSVGNVIGSNIYNILAVIGLVAVLVPIRVSASTKTIELPLLVAFTVVALALLGFRERLSRLEGGILLGGYGMFIYVLLVTRGF
ncbi:calcium/sodium antiporter [Halosimplex pelagicum]|uniref:Calcium/sodium antiporter n=1 Tax=Halosimplex pelagicum TaxID=869886 RepID=A0A7D5TGT8_9EURY|nr:calcium/sodium antiporter [Halosimplex pelagicum]QLH82036.1 calcium/sodium antiporter [Halosimplex pelagicum]